MVRVKARPELTGVVTQVDESGSQLRLTVFHGQLTQTYYESQVEVVETKGGEHLTAEELKARLTAAHVLHPSVSRLYSLNSGRIEYEPYQYRPVMKLINADRPRLLIADDVGVGKTIEAGLIIKELQARQKLDSILVICPKPLVVEDKWRSELKRFDEDFAHLDSATLAPLRRRDAGRGPLAGALPEGDPAVLAAGREAASRRRHRAPPARWAWSRSCRRSSSTS